MRYTLIKGYFHVISQSPDADSVKFRAHDPTLWEHINTENRDIFERKFAEENGIVTIRLEGIDALETHYTPPNLPAPDDVKPLRSATLTAPKPEGYKQPPTLARHSADQLLSLLGVQQPKWRTFGNSRYISEALIEINGETRLIKEKLADPIPGFVITGDIEMNGRPVAWVYRGASSIPDGLTVTTDDLAQGIPYSLNYQLLSMGMVYPYYYMSLAGKLRHKLTQATQIARAAAQRNPTALNIWNIDATVPGIELPSLNILTTDKAIYPYLFRKIIKHEFKRRMEAYWSALRAGSLTMPELTAVNLDGLMYNADPYVFVISDQDFVRLSDILVATGNTLRLLKPPDDLVFLSN